MAFCAFRANGVAGRLSAGADSGLLLDPFIIGVQQLHDIRRRQKFPRERRLPGSIRPGNDVEDKGTRDGHRD